MATNQLPKGTSVEVMYNSRGEVTGARVVGPDGTWWSRGELGVPMGEKYIYVPKPVPRKRRVTSNVHADHFNRRE